MNSVDFDWYISVIVGLLTQLPVFLVYLTGIILALLRWKKHPQVSLFLLSSFVILFVTAVVLTIVERWIPYRLSTMNVSPQTYGFYFTGLGIVNNLVHAASYALLLFAVLIQRPAQSSTEK